MITLPSSLSLHLSITVSTSIYQYIFMYILIHSNSFPGDVLENPLVLAVTTQNCRGSITNLFTCYIVIVFWDGRRRAWHLVVASRTKKGFFIYAFIVTLINHLQYEIFSRNYCTELNFFIPCHTNLDFAAQKCSKSFDLRFGPTHRRNVSSKHARPRPWLARVNLRTNLDGGERGFRLLQPKRKPSETARRTLSPPKNRKRVCLDRKTDALRCDGKVPKAGAAFRFIKTRKTVRRKRANEREREASAGAEMDSIPSINLGVYSRGFLCH